MINSVDNVNWPPFQSFKADVSSVSPWSERRRRRRANARNVSFETLTLANLRDQLS